MAFNPPPLKAGPSFGAKGGTSIGPRIQPPIPQGAPPPPKAPRGVRIEERIGVQAPASVIWEILADLPRWSEWNPTYPKAAGELRMHSVLTLTLALPGEEPEEIRPRVLDWVPNEQLLWELKALHGLIKTTRYIEIDHLAEASCVVDNGEIFGGLMGPSLGRKMGKVVQRGFRAMNEALKARAEAMWAERKAV